jgi:drug/metabolite transporter (DMT)-like permease
MCPVQNAVVGMILGASFIGLTLVALRMRQDRGESLPLKLALGAVIGGVAAAVAVAIRADLVPDSIEVTVAALLVLGVAGVSAYLFLRHRLE